MQNLTEEQQIDVKARLADFEKRLGDLQKELSISIDAVPQWIPSDHGFTTTCLIGLRDTKYIPTPSPLSSLIQSK